ncbi:GAF domain-containing sensor histidine kinase [Aliterella atlantica]|uniref:histidine kinase n=1 Tax=Aliterella atlantica CENA595 TaxID=1618023 RepID=A0A0D8ZXZ5_9CYAN|nr:GAF domain-containing sensor histidine kinase [Aliterella atlantica]KJH73247.1 histidine kinase [Aliterella atlantica CENA595]
MLTTTDFVTLCQVQVAMLAQRLGAVWSIVYLTEELAEQGSSEAKLIPVVAYPETLAQRQKAGALIPQETGAPSLLQLPAAPTSVPIPAWESLTDEAKAQLLPSRQIVLPLMYEGILMGLLVTGREDRPWNESERNEIEKIAQTLAIARSLDRQNKWYEQQLIQQQRLQRQQRDLLDDLLHQFRNPLTALRTFGKLLLKRFAPGDANRSVADSIVRESDRLQELLLQFDRAIDLTVADLEAQKALPPAQEPPAKPLPLLLGQGNSQVCLVAEVLAPLVASAKAIAQERNLQLIAEIPANLPPVKADRAALREIFSNLIDNALKYTPSGGEIYIQSGKQRDRAQGIEISDTGLGIPPADLGKIFERHYRGVQENSAIAGTGLGLAIVKELVEQMQGEIEVFSPAQNGSGSKFVVWLPIAA